MKCKKITNSTSFEENCNGNESILPMDSIEISSEFLDFMTENNAKEIIVQQNQPPCDNILKQNLEQLLMPIEAATPSEDEFEIISDVDIETLLNTVSFPLNQSEIRFEVTTNTNVKQINFESM